MEIKQRSCFLLTLVREVASGRMLPAAMQRPYVWTKVDVLALCDSLLSGFPIGAFLAWSPGRKANLAELARCRLGPLEALSAHEAGFDPYSLLLDGQNRAATLAWMMHRSDSDLPDTPDSAVIERETWLSGEVLVLDWATRGFLFVPASEAESKLRMPAWTLFSNASEGTRVTANQHYRALMAKVWPAYAAQDEIDDFIEFWDKSCDRVREAQVTLTVIEDATPAEARHAFLRISRVGVPMSQVDFDNAVGWTPAADI